MSNRGDDIMPFNQNLQQTPYKMQQNCSDARYSDALRHDEGVALSNNPKERVVVVVIAAATELLITRTFVQRARHGWQRIH